MDASPAETADHEKLLGTSTPVERGSKTDSEKCWIGWLWEENPESLAVEALLSRSETSN